MTKYPTGRAGARVALPEQPTASLGTPIPRAPPAPVQAVSAPAGYMLTGDAPADPGRGPNYVKVVCRDCGWHGFMGDTLLAPNPFDPGHEMVGCPDCRTPESMLRACEAIDCWRQATCGWLDDRGHHQACSQHMG